METSSATSVYLVFGDLHGRILPAFRFAAYWSARTGRAVDGLLQVGDLGYFPDISRMDQATVRHAAADALELGALGIVTRNELADRVFAESTFRLWFTAGNHEDFTELEQLAGMSQDADFAVDAYARVRAIKDGALKRLGSGLRVAAVWGVDGRGPNIRKGLPPRGYIAEQAIDGLLVEPFEVLLCHDAPRDSHRAGYGSELLTSLIELAKPRFVFHGHYHGDGKKATGDFGRTEVFHVTGFELRTKGGHPERGSVGVLEWGDEPSFEFVADEDLKPFTRHNWKWLGG